MNPYNMSMEKIDHNPSEDDEVLLEQMLIDAERLAIQMRTAAGFVGDCIKSDEVCQDIFRTVPDTIETFDNQTECSSIGLGHGVESLKWSPTIFSGHQDYGPKLTIPEETVFDDVSGANEQLDCTGNDQHPSTIRSRSIKRSIEELVQKSKACVQLEANLRNVASSSSGESELEKSSNPCSSDRSNINNEMTIRKCESNEETVLGSVGTKYHDVHSVAKQEEKKCDDDENLLNLDMLNQFRRDIISTSLDFNLDENSNESEKEATSVSTTSHSDTLFQVGENLKRELQALEASSEQIFNTVETSASPHDITTLSVGQRKESFGDNFRNQQLIVSNEKSDNHHTFISSPPVVGSGWMNVNVVTRQDDDYASIADYCQPKLKNEIPNDLRSRKSYIGNVRWENMASAKVGDEDFTSVQDYCFTSADIRLASEFYRNKDKHSGSYRALLVRREKSKRKRFAIASCLSLFIISLLYYNWTQEIEPFIVQIVSKRWLLLLETRIDKANNFITTPKEEIVVDVSPTEIPSIFEMKNFWFIIHQHMCASECLDLFNHHASDGGISVPLECYGALDLHKELYRPAEKALDLQMEFYRPTEEAAVRHKKVPPICFIPIISNVFPICREKKRKRKP